MTSSEMREFQKVLKDRKHGLLRALRKCLDRPLESQSVHPMGPTADLTEQELVWRIFILAIARLRDLEEALRAIRQGSFGRCTSCDGDIPLNRLEAAPWVSRCMACGESAEGAATQFEEMEIGKPPTERKDPCQYCARRRTAAETAEFRGCLPSCPSGRAKRTATAQGAHP